MTALESNAPASGRPLTLDDYGLLIWASLGVIVPGFFPQATPAVVVLSVVAPLLRADRGRLNAASWKPGPVVTVLGVIAAYLVVNVMLAPATSNAGIAIAAILIGTIAVHLCRVALPAVQTWHLTLMARGAVYGYLVALCFLLIEYVTRMSLQRSLEHALAALNVSFITIRTGTWEHPYIWGMSRNLIVMVMVLWAVCAFVSLCMPPRQSRPWVAAFLILTGACVLLSPSGTAKLGFFSGAVAWRVAVHAPKLANVALKILWTTMTLAIVPMAQLINQFRLFDLAWLPSSGRHRLMIWSASAEWFWHKPLMGLGIGGARHMNLNQGLNITTDGLGAIPLEWHAHNSYVQAWLEAGVIGGLLLCLLGWLVIHAIERAPNLIQPTAYATLTTVMFVAMTGFSLWAPWYLCAYALAAVFVMLAMTRQERDAGLPQPSA